MLFWRVKQRGAVARWKRNGAVKRMRFEFSALRYLEDKSERPLSMSRKHSVPSGIRVGIGVFLYFWKSKQTGALPAF